MTRIISLVWKSLSNQNLWTWRKTKIIISCSLVVCYFFTFHVNVTNNQKENNECCYSPEVELGGGRVRRNPPIAIFGIQPGQYQSRKENYWIKACLRYKVTRIMIISDSTSIKVSGMVTAQRQRSDSARLAIKTFLHNFFL